MQHKNIFNTCFFLLFFFWRMLCQCQCIIRSPSEPTVSLLLLPVYMGIFSTAFCKMQIKPLLYCFLPMLAVNGSFESSLQQGGVEHFFSNECGFSRGRVPFPAEFIFPLHTYYVLRGTLQKPRKIAPRLSGWRAVTFHRRAAGFKSL